jgi:hypothetical protein
MTSNNKLIIREITSILVKSNLKYILNPEGYSVRRSTGGYAHNYYLKDRLGNNRVMLEINRLLSVRDAICQKFTSRTTALQVRRQGIRRNIRVELVRFSYMAVGYGNPDIYNTGSVDGDVLFG